MIKNYKFAALAVMGRCISQMALAQTHFGMGAGMQGQFHSHFGVDAGKVSTGPFNTFIGQESGASNQFANDNTFVGYKSGALNTDGIENTFIGSLAGNVNATGFQNVFWAKMLVGLMSTEG
jgi:trimeric autotransporter adhesin